MEANDSNTIAVHNPRARKLRSLVWNDFTKERKADGSYVAICNHCKKQLTASSRSGTTHLKNHLVICTSTKRIKRKKLVVRRLVLNGNSGGYSSAEFGNDGECKTSRITLSDTQLSPVDALALVPSAVSLEGNGDEVMVPAGSD
ncbi:hypothetical protein BHM03_00008275 [Ensete ventricosum]|uniref:BED-type domain-containing protein n=1 Tax=Ensete ventricosum TaxID=4639 RepID=A0A426YDF6_ENSVE|nr:hypothetical protein B296_00044609 [Ensete ventricosum]RZR81955.1 hypothetical protein BHM03_00008275 [Ensete ventricosum]